MHNSEEVSLNVNCNLYSGFQADELVTSLSQCVTRDSGPVKQVWVGFRVPLTLTFSDVISNETHCLGWAMSRGGESGRLLLHSKKLGHIQGEL